MNYVHIHVPIRTMTRDHHASGIILHEYQFLSDTNVNPTEPNAMLLITKYLFCKKRNVPTATISCRPTHSKPCTNVNVNALNQRRSSKRRQRSKLTSSRNASSGGQNWEMVRGQDLSPPSKPPVPGRTPIADRTTKVATQPTTPTSIQPQLKERSLGVNHGISSTTQSTEEAKTILLKSTEISFKRPKTNHATSSVNSNESNLSDLTPFDLMDFLFPKNDFNNKLVLIQYHIREITKLINELKSS